jgi:hypothetical protein
MSPITRLRRSVKRLVAAEISHEWKGSQPAEEIKAIERELAVARKRYEDAVGGILMAIQNAAHRARGGA